MKIITSIVSAIILATSLTANAAHHGNHKWSLSPQESKISYGSIKNDTIGEINHFKTISGSINTDGQVSINIDLTSIETNIDIRNKRILKHVFDAARPTAKLTANIDITKIKSLPIGATALIDTTGTLSILNNDIKIETSFFVARLNKDRFVAMSDEMIMLKTADLGVDAGIDILQQLAKLNNITRIAPVNLRLVFEKK